MAMDPRTPVIDAAAFSSTTSELRYSQNFRGTRTAESGVHSRAMRYDGKGRQSLSES